VTGIHIRGVIDIEHVVFAAFLLIFSLAVTRYMLHQARIMDVPQERSSHHAPTPTCGGISIVAAFIVGVAAFFVFVDSMVIMKGYFLGFVLSALLIAGISLYDDIKNKPYIIKLTTQVLAALLVLAFGIVLDVITVPFSGVVALGWLGYPLSFIWIIGLTNTFNFMDGLDGMAAGVAGIVSAFFCAITFIQGSIIVYMTCYVLFAATLGFLIYNFPPARIFMGDVGSTFLGFVFAVLAIIAARYDYSHTSFFVMPLLLFNFIYDVSFTFSRRLSRGERVIDAHRTHLYQLFQQIGYGHLEVSLFHYGVCVLQGIGAVWMVHIPGNRRLLDFLPFLCFQIVYSYIIMKSAKRAGLV
jgi:UDP-GlcNAc:undecaprenyl-phosphate GlcNAc-1-phosphate transferase